MLVNNFLTLVNYEMNTQGHERERTGTGLSLCIDTL